MLVSFLVVAWIPQSSALMMFMVSNLLYIVCTLVIIMCMNFTVDRIG